MAGARGRVGDPARAVAAAARVATETGARLVQLLDARAVVDPEQLQVAAERALRAYGEDRAVSKELGLEVLRYASGERQIADALRRLGLRADTERVGVVAVGPNAKGAVDRTLQALGLARDDTALQGGRDALLALGVGAVELRVVPEDAWVDLVLERVALVDVERR
ncbi:MAG TPA: KEOPS complex subunit Cgi121 [Candidatus Thermoplasmatota archaeon]|nr:KEOPS complex subunit Cgi121 [Candidatus Thermoplasmatota archaeon]